ncbi:MAG: GerMN domain-containing protein [Actinomycetota bacterium]
MNTRHHLALICVAALAVSACGIANDAAPRDIPLQQRSALIDAPVQAPATSTGTDRIFLLAPQLPDQPSHLRATPRDVGPSIEARLNSLFGPLSVAEAQGRLLTAIPEGLNLHSAALQTNGTLTIDVTDEILSLSSGALIESVAQIVFTALEVRNVQRVQLLVNGTSQQWPGGDGSLRTTALSAFDFPGLIETSQPNFPAVPSPNA